MDPKPFIEKAFVDQHENVRLFASPAFTFELQFVRYYAPQHSFSINPSSSSTTVVKAQASSKKKHKTQAWRHVAPISHRFVVLGIRDVKSDGTKSVNQRIDVIYRTFQEAVKFNKSLAETDTSKRLAGVLVFRLNNERCNPDCHEVYRSVVETLRRKEEQIKIFVKDNNNSHGTINPLPSLSLQIVLD